MKAGIRIALGGTLMAGALAFAGIATAAPGDTVYTGETDTGAKVKLTVASPGNATKYKIGKTKVECDEGGTLSNKPGTYTNFDRSDPGKFTDSRTSRNSSGDFDFKTKSKLKGSINDDDASWSGTIKLTTKVFDGNEQIDTCKLKTGWSVA